MPAGDASKARREARGAYVISLTSTCRNRSVGTRRCDKRSTTERHSALGMDWWRTSRSARSCGHDVLPIPLPRLGESNDGCQCFDRHRNGSSPHSAHSISESARLFTSKAGIFSRPRIAPIWGRAKFPKRHWLKVIDRVQWSREVGSLRSLTLTGEAVAGHADRNEAVEAAADRIGGGRISADGEARPPLHQDGDGERGQMIDPVFAADASV
jgi:hypothetical protein